MEDERPVAMDLARPTFPHLPGDEFCERAVRRDHGVGPLDISYSAITDQNLVDMCRASPLLKTLRVILVPNFDRVVETIAGKIDEIAAQVSRACPLLESVYFPTPGRLSQAESYQMHFPNIKEVCLWTRVRAGVAP